MQNEPNLKIDPMNVTKVLTTDYNSWTLGIRGKNEPKTNPNEPNFMQNEPKTNPICYLKAYLAKTKSYLLESSFRFFLFRSKFIITV